METKDENEDRSEHGYGNEAKLCRWIDGQDRGRGMELKAEKAAWRLVGCV